MVVKVSSSFRLCNTASDAGLDRLLSLNVRQSTVDLWQLARRPVGSGTMPVGKRSRNSSGAVDPPISWPDHCCR